MAKVYKFGGGVLDSARSIRMMTDIVRKDHPTVVVVSALHKMTNAFEQLLKQFHQPNVKISLDEIYDFHYQIALDLWDGSSELAKRVLDDSFDQIQSGLKNIVDLEADKGYDQIISFGEMLSTTIISEYWRTVHLDHQLIDARQVILTDETWKAARPDYSKSKEALVRIISDQTKVHLLPGFIGGTSSGFTTTLGREGSDYSAALLANWLDAEEVVVWKDVPGIMTADPSAFEAVSLLPAISYLEAVELSYFGAKVIHPNTIKPLQNKGIPLVVKSFYSPEESGTRVHYENQSQIVDPIIICKKEQVLVSIQPRDFSFIFEAAVSKIFTMLDQYQIRVNLIQHGAVSLSLVFDLNQSKLDRLLHDLLPEFKVLYNTGVDLWTIRHYTSDAIQKIVGEKQVFIEQKSRGTVRLILG